MLIEVAGHHAVERGVGDVVDAGTPLLTLAAAREPNEVLLGVARDLQGAT